MALALRLLKLMAAGRLVLPEVTVSIFNSSSLSSETTTSKRGPLALLGALAAVSLLGATGCVAEVQPAPVVAYAEPVAYEEPVVYVDEVPVNVESYPSVYYGGTYVYYVGDRWYYRSPRGWAYYRHEPRWFGSYRADFERRYPHVYAGGGVYSRTYTRTYTEAHPHTYHAPAYHAPTYHAAAHVSVQPPAYHAQASGHVSAHVSARPSHVSSGHRR